MLTLMAFVFLACGEPGLIGPSGQGDSPEVAPVVWALGEGFRVDPLTGRAREHQRRGGDPLPAEFDYQHRNFVWDAGKRQITLHAARNEVVAYQLQIRGPASAVKVECSDLKGPKTIKRPLDEVGTLLWEMSDGEHNLVEIYIAEQERFHERVEPVDKVVGGLLETMLRLGLLQLDHRPKDPGAKGGKSSAKKVIVRARDK